MVGPGLAVDLGESIVSAHAAKLKVGSVRLANVRFGSKAEDVCSASTHVRFTPKSGHVRIKEFIAFSVPCRRPLLIARWNVFRPQIEFHLECIAAARCDPLGRP